MFALKLYIKDDKQSPYLMGLAKTRPLAKKIEHNMRKMAPKHYVYKIEPYKAPKEAPKPKKRRS